MTRMYLQGKQDKKRRGFILTGACNSGKTTIGKYVSRIFDTHTLRQNGGTFEEKMEKEDSNKQVLFIDEAHVYNLFSKKRLYDTKLLLEGSGKTIENKFSHAYTGFEGC